VSARFVAACDSVLGADGALVALLPDVVWEKELRRQERSSARDRLASSPRPVSGHGEGGGHLHPTDRRGLVDAGFAAALGPGRAVVPAVARAIDPALPGHWTSLLAILGAHDAAYGPREVLGAVRRELQVIAGHRQAARGDLRTDLMRVEARWTIYAAWLCEDTGDRRGRAALLERALQLAREADHPDLMGVGSRATGAVDRSAAGAPSRRGPTHSACRRAHTRAVRRASRICPRTIADADTTARLLADAHTLPRRRATRRRCPRTRGYRVSSCAAGRRAAGHCWSPPRAWHCTTTCV